jgi:predicted RNase H-like nuclease (RuvC/YqgF family)
VNELTTKVSELENSNQELLETIELVTLDKEMAEERLETFQLEATHGATVPDQNIEDLEFENQRLKEALIK